jgi:hypothetical protein
MDSLKILIADDNDLMRHTSSIPCRTMRLVAKVSQRREERIMDDLRFPEWQKPYQDAILEAKPEKLRAAETAIIRRMEQLEASPDSQVERQAMKNALEALYVLMPE